MMYLTSKNVILKPEKYLVTLFFKNDFYQDYWK